MRLHTADNTSVILAIIAPVLKVLKQPTNCTCLLGFVPANSSVKEITPRMFKSASLE